MRGCEACGSRRAVRRIEVATEFRGREFRFRPWMCGECAPVLLKHWSRLVGDMKLYVLAGAASGA